MIGALDFSMRGCGLCKGTDESNLQYMTADVKSFKKNYYMRNQFIIREVCDYLYGCERVFLEGYSLRSKGKIIDIAEVCGSIKYALKRNNTRIFLVSPKSLKLAAYGNGDAEKQDGIDAMRRLGYNVQDDNQSDAVALFLIGIGYFQCPTTAEWYKEVL